MSQKGVIYILTNPSFPQYVKIGYRAQWCDEGYVGASGTPIYR